MPSSAGTNAKRPLTGSGAERLTNVQCAAIPLNPTSRLQHGQVTGRDGGHHHVPPAPSRQGTAGRTRIATDAIDDDLERTVCAGRHQWGGAGVVQHHGVGVGTALPAASTTPAKSTPTTTGGRGPSNRAASRNGPEARIFQSTGLTPTACTLTRTRRPWGNGVGNSINSSGAPARQLRCAIAFTGSNVGVDGGTYAGTVMVDLDRLLSVAPPTEQPWHTDPDRHWRSIDRAVGSRDSPVAALSLPALRHNVIDLQRRAGGVPLRIATKSLRVRPIIDALVRLDRVVGVLAYDLAEAIWLATDAPDRRGIADVLLGYPSADRRAIADLCANEQARQRVTVLVDCVDQLDLIDAIQAPTRRDPIRVAIDLDAALRLPVIGDLGVLRSPVHTVDEAVRLARVIADRPGFALVGVMSYEAQVAGVGNAVRGKPLENSMIRAMQAVSMAELRSRRRRVIDAIGQIADLQLVNAGGTGSIEVTAHDRSVTDIAVGSGFFGGHLFDSYRHFFPAPALGFALSVVRKPRPDVVTCHGGGWIASGPPAADRLPQAVWPAGLSYLPREAAGEVQTPLRGDAATALQVGDRVWFRHTKSGEPSEHVNTIVLIDQDVVGEVRTYRGEGQAFL